MITKVKVKGKHIEFQLDGGGYGVLRVVPPKLPLPIIENASLEDDDELQDLWANLLASAVDPNYNGRFMALSPVKVTVWRLHFYHRL